VIKSKPKKWGGGGGWLGRYQEKERRLKVQEEKRYVQGDSPSATRRERIAKRGTPEFTERKGDIRVRNETNGKKRRGESAVKVRVVPESASEEAPGEKQEEKLGRASMGE